MVASGNDLQAATTSKAQGAQWAANKMWDFSPKNVGI